MANASSPIIGIAKTAIVLDLEGQRKAIISAVHAGISSKKLAKRVEIIGPVELNDESIVNIQTTAVRIIDRLMTELGMDPIDFIVSFSNPGAISAQDNSLQIEGFSAELSIFMAMVSTALQLPIPQDTVMTGHMASAGGDLAPVSGVPQKLNAAIDDPDTARFIFPSLESDQSLKSLTPLEFEKCKGAIDDCHNDIHAKGVKDIAEVFIELFNEDNIALSSLKNGFFGLEKPGNQNGGPIEGSLFYLLNDNPSRFWKALESNLLAKDISTARLFLQEFAHYHARVKDYPSGLGDRLMKLILSLPPTVKRNRDLFPLIPMRDCMQLAQYAMEKDYPDVLMLFDSIRGKRVEILSGEIKAPIAKSPEPDSMLEYFLNELSAESIAREIFIPIDEARASYIMDSIQAASNDEFNEAISAFYVHIFRHIGQLQGPLNISHALDNALALLERAFQNNGGIITAYAEGRNPVKGGLRFIFNLMTERLKQEEKEKHILAVFKGTLDPLDFDEKVSIIKVFIQKAGSTLPEQIRSYSPGYYANHYEDIIRAYSESLEKVIGLLKIL
jgi:hypothetical protein